MCKGKGFDAELFETLALMVVHTSGTPQAQRMQPALRRLELTLVCSLLLIAVPLCTPLMTHRHGMHELRCNICS